MCTGAVGYKYDLILSPLPNIYIFLIDEDLANDLSLFLECVRLLGQEVCLLLCTLVHMVRWFI